MQNLLKDRRTAREEVRRDALKAKGYSIDGRAIRGETPAWRKALAVSAVCAAAILAAIYGPPMFYKGEKPDTYTPIPADAAAIKAYQTYLKDHPESDFDDDGMDNALEGEHGTDVWDMDTDGDGVSDYAEMFITETSPTDATSVLVDQVIKQDGLDGNTLGTPYKVDDIIFWPDDYRSKAYGAVVRTLEGYRFCNFSGWVKFPRTVYAYQYKGGVLSDLEYRQNEDAWHVSSPDEVLLFEAPLTFTHRLTLPVAGSVDLPDNAFGRFLSKALPDKGGPITCCRQVVGGLTDRRKVAASAPLSNPLVNKGDYSRLSSNRNSLKDLAWVYRLVDAGYCVAVSMYSGNVGEAIGIVYGYTKGGDLLVADESLTPAGTIDVTERAGRVMDKDGVIGQATWFEWKGLGFDSEAYHDRISFFSSTATAVEAAGGQDVQEAAADEGGSSPEAQTAAPETQDAATDAQTSDPETQAQATETQDTVQETQAPDLETQAQVADTEIPQTDPPQTEAPRDPDSLITFSI